VVPLGVWVIIVVCTVRANNGGNGEIPTNSGCEGIFDRSFVFNFVVGHVDHNIKDVIRNAGDPKFKPLNDELVHIHKLLFAFRLIHHNDIVPDIEINLENRNAELTKPTLRLFASRGDSQKALTEIRQALSRFIVEKNELKSNSIESKLCTVINELMNERDDNPTSEEYDGLEDYAFTNEQIWHKCKKVMDGIDILGKSESFYSIDYGAVTHKKISSLIQSKFKVVPFKTSGDNSKRGWQFQKEFIDRLSLHYTNEIKEIVIHPGTHKTASDASHASHYKSAWRVFDENDDAVASCQTSDTHQASSSSEPAVSVEQSVNNSDKTEQDTQGVTNMSSNSNDDNDNDNSSGNLTDTNNYNIKYNTTEINHKDNSNSLVANLRTVNDAGSAVHLISRDRPNRAELYSKIPYRPYYLITYALKKTKSRFHIGSQRQVKQLSSELEKLIAGPNVGKIIKTWNDLTQVTIDSTQTDNDNEYSLHIVDALSGEILQKSEIDEHKVMVTVFSKSDKAVNDVIVSREKNQTIDDLMTVQPVTNYKMKQTGEYGLEIKQALIHQNAAERMVLEQVVQDTKSKHHEVSINGSLLIFVPRWSTSIKSRETDRHYSRQALAASRTVLCDEIELCSKDYSSSILRKSEIRKTFAACDRCGQVLCRQHIKMVDGHYFCDEHAESTKSAKLDNTNSRFNTIASKMRLKASFLYNIDRIAKVGSRIVPNPKIIRNASSSNPLAALKNSDTTTAIKVDSALSITNINRSPVNPDRIKTQETTNQMAKSSLAKKITRYTSDGKPLQ